MSSVQLCDNLIDNVKAELERRGWTQRELAARSGLHWQTIQRILSGGMTPSIDVCEKIAIALEFKPERIFRKPG